MQTVINNYYNEYNMKLLIELYNHYDDYRLKNSKHNYHSRILFKRKLYKISKLIFILFKAVI